MIVLDSQMITAVAALLSSFAALIWSFRRKA